MKISACRCGKADRACFSFPLRSHRLRRVRGGVSCVHSLPLGKERTKKTRQGVEYPLQPRCLRLRLLHYVPQRRRRKMSLNQRRVCVLKKHANTMGGSFLLLDRKRNWDGRHGVLGFFEAAHAKFSQTKSLRLALAECERSEHTKTPSEPNRTLRSNAIFQRAAPFGSLSFAISLWNDKEMA